MQKKKKNEENFWNVFENESSLCHKLWFSNFNIFATQSRRFYKVLMDKPISSIVIKIFVKMFRKNNEILNVINNIWKCFKFILTERNVKFAKLLICWNLRWKEKEKREEIWDM